MFLDCFWLQVHCDATIAFPLLVSQTFAPRMKLEGKKRRDLATLMKDELF